MPYNNKRVMELQTTALFQQLEGRHIISMVIPAFNSEDTIESTITSVEKCIEDLGYQYEVLVIDDGSTDKTFEKISKLSSEHIKVIRNSPNRGKGFSMKEGILASSGDYVIMLDSDLEIGIDMIQTYISALKEKDIVISSKRHPQAIYRAPFMRKLFSAGFNVLVRILTGVNVSDSQTGFKAFRGESIRYLMKLVSVKRYAFDVEVLAIAKITRMEIAEFPAHIVQDKSFSSKAILYMLVDLIGIAYRLRIIKWYQRNIHNPSPSYRPILNL